MGACQQLIVVLPGIGGTRLAVPDVQGRPSKNVVWGARLQDSSLLRHPERLSIGEYPRLVPAGLIPSRTLFGLWTPVHGYGELLDQLGKRPGAILDDGTNRDPNLDATVVAVGYDFRLGVADAAAWLDTQLQPRLKRLWPDQVDRAGRVVFLAHSMGGLVARYWAAVLGRASLCRAIITLGTPHRGAPKALEVMANGVPVKGGFHLRRTIELAREWPGMADLLPRYPAVLATSTQSDGTTTSTMKRPHELGLEWLTGLAVRAHGMHADIESHWAALADPPPVYPRIGFGHRTLRACTSDGVAVKVTDELPPASGLGEWGPNLGDGTVPAYCGLPVGADARLRTSLLVPHRHGPIVGWDQLIGLLNDVEVGASALKHFQAGDEQVGLGLDLDEVQLAGQPIPVEVRPVRADGAQVDAAEAAVWVSARGLAGPDGGAFVGDGRAEDVRLEWDADRGVFTGTLPGFAPGSVEITVTAQFLTDHTPTQTVEVLDDAGLE